MHPLDTVDLVIRKQRRNAHDVKSPFTAHENVKLKTGEIIKKSAINMFEFITCLPFNVFVWLIEMMVYLI